MVINAVASIMVFVFINKEDFFVAKVDFQAMQQQLTL